MESKMSEVTTGEILRKAQTMASFEWKIHDFSRLPEEMGYCIRSPTFSFLDAKWRLEIFPNGEDESNEWVSIYVIKAYSITEDHYVGYHVGIRKQDGTDCASIRGVSHFEGNEAIWGDDIKLRRPILLQMKSEIAPQDAMTIFCILHSNVCESKEVASQTMHPEGLEKLLQNLQELFNAEDGDVVLRVKGQEFRAHKAVLGVRSSVFKSMFSHGMKEDTSGVVDVTDCDPTVFRDFLYYLYCGKVEEFSTAKVFDLYIVADKYDIDELKTMCIEFIIDNMSTDTFFDSIILALRYNESMVLEHATNYFIENSINIIKTAEWLSFMKENIAEANELVIKAMENKIYQ